MMKLSIVEDREEDKYEYLTALKDWKSDPTNGMELPDASADPSIKGLVDQVMTSMSSARQSEVKAWEEEIIACEHTLTLQQVVAGSIPASGLAHCSKCDLKENLWLCLTCGSLGCGRSQYGGIGGNGHGLSHYTETQHPVSVKLGTITPEGAAGDFVYMRSMEESNINNHFLDIYCYACNDAKVDPELASHLSNFGINVQTQTKTEKSMTELVRCLSISGNMGSNADGQQIEHNLKFDFSLTDESGKALEPVFGPGLTGLANLGNSCYMASVIQALFSLGPFQERYLATASEHWKTCLETLPANCLDCQMHKIADGLLSGRYSRPRSQSTLSPLDPKLTNPLAHDSPTPVFQEGIRPVTFKALIGKGHEEFATMRQQDSEEFFTYLLASLRRNAKRTGTSLSAEPTEIFSFGIEQRLQCTECKGVRYRVDGQDVLSIPVPAREKGKDVDGKTQYEEVRVKECLDIAMGVESLEYKCPQCQKDVVANKRSRLSTFPQVLVLHAKKFQLVNWVPTKLDIPLIFPSNDVIELDDYLGRGLQPGETELVEEQKDAPGLPQFHEASMAQLEAMGFPIIRCQKALLATGNNDAEAAMEWLFAHMEDPDIDAPIAVDTLSGGTSSEPDPEHINMLVDMGFTPAQVRKALRETNSDPARAVEWLFSHPEDTGEDSTSAPSSSAEASGLGGTRTLPARYMLKAFVSHKGPSVHSGHYVAHVRLGDRWILFNDEKVVAADQESVKELKELAYLYIFERL
ncbi:hypothetical protein EW146_g6207 [Bondarzewia mesenterica]|uniref:Ubiquitin carboxyl-terminal hydrolase n=1 Tax=Bondarzewia mesenterica TaxID=1095465 RepID=A0A4V3XEL7_9AGAM|nr:hypothetical protein EW146_g6207 [Bondarzewia mesenterica]